MDWAFVHNDARAPPTCYKMDADLLESCDDLNDLRTQCESFVLNHAPRGIHSEKVCQLSRDAIREWVSKWRRPLISEVCWTAEGDICKVSATVPHWNDTTECVFLCLSHNGSWCVCRELKGDGPEIRKCMKDIKKSGIYLSGWDVSQRALGDACSSHAIHYGSKHAWRLSVIE